MSKLKITKCPMCASKRIRRVRRDVKGTFRGRPYVVRGVEFEECPDCGESLYDLDAMAKLESARSALNVGKRVTADRKRKPSMRSSQARHSG